MPTYTFFNKRTKKEFDDMMSIADMEEYLQKNKHIKQVIKGINIIASVGNRTTKTDSGFKEVLSKIGEAHPQSELAKQTTKKSIKQIKTEQAVAKNKRRIAGKK
jgi:oligoendopeptidase F|tara:strand:- start:1178 stop:1489 length:312 start_codon:yes stop_codon:yes gene_type:complete